MHYGAPAGWSRCARELPMASTNRTGESRRRQVLPVDLATVESTRWRRCFDRGTVWGPLVTYVFTDRGRGVFRGEKEPAKAVASLLLW